jgi:putative FmdB family regulatory protein
MPIYAYRCTSCGHAKDVLQKVSDPLLTQCPACGQETFTKQVTAAGFQLKGSGWYVTDFRGGNNAGAKADGEAGDKAADKGEGQAGEKPADKATADQGNSKSADGSAAADKTAPKGSAPAAAAPAPASPSAPSAPSAPAAPSPSPPASGS